MFETTNHIYIYPLVICYSLLLKPWPNRNSGFTQLENSGSFHVYIYKSTIFNILVGFSMYWLDFPGMYFPKNWLVSLFQFTKLFAGSRRYAATTNSWQKSFWLCPRDANPGHSDFSPRSKRVTSRVEDMDI